MENQRISDQANKKTYTVGLQGKFRLGHFHEMAGGVGAAIAGGGALTLLLRQFSIHLATRFCQVMSESHQVDAAESFHAKPYFHVHWT